MPTYDYRCEACGHGFEKFQPMTAAPIRKCPRCGKLRVRRLLGGGAGLIFKGGGFYVTDYRSESYKNAAKADSGAASSDGKAPVGASSSTESKPGAKSTSEKKQTRT